MGLIYKPLRFRGEKKSKELRALMDTGASASFIRATEARQLGKPQKTLLPCTVRLGKGTARVRQEIQLAVSLNGHRVRWHFLVMEGMTEAVVIGADFFQRFHIKLDPEKGEVIVDPTYLEVTLI